MKIRKWLQELDELYAVYDGSVLYASEPNDSLDYLLFDATNHQENAEREIKKRVIWFLEHEYLGRVNRLIASKIEQDPKCVKTMNAFYRYMHTLGKYRILTFASIPMQQERKGKTLFANVYCYFRKEFMQCFQKTYNEPFRKQYPIGNDLRGEFLHWKEYIRTEMCNDGFDSDAIWKKMVDLICTVAIMDELLVQT